MDKERSNYIRQVSHFLIAPDAYWHKELALTSKRLRTLHSRKNQQHAESRQAHYTEVMLMSRIRWKPCLPPPAGIVYRNERKAEWAHDGARGNPI